MPLRVNQGRKRTARSYQPALDKDAADDQRKAVMTLHGTVSATLTDKTIFKAPVDCIIKRIALVVETTVAAHDTNYWTFNVENKGSGDANLLATAIDTTIATGAALTAYTARNITPDQNNRVKAGDVLALTATKVSSGANLVNLSVTVEYQVDGVTTTTSTSSTTTTTTTTTTSTTTTTTTTTTTSTTTTVT